MSKDEWIWMPHPGHFICADHCRFHLNTYVNGYIISTVGEHLPDSKVRDIIAKCRGIKLEGKGDICEADYMEKIGYEDMGASKGYKYETMIFKAKRNKDKKDWQCCPYRADVSKEMGSERYKTATEAFEGHMKHCLEYDETPEIITPRTKKKIWRK